MEQTKELINDRINKLKILGYTENDCPILEELVKTLVLLDKDCGEFIKDISTDIIKDADDIINGKEINNEYRDFAKETLKYCKGRDSEEKQLNLFDKYLENSKPYIAGGCWTPIVPQEWQNEYEKSRKNNPANTDVTIKITEPPKKIRDDRFFKNLPSEEDLNRLKERKRYCKEHVKEITEELNKDQKPIHVIPNVTYSDDEFSVTSLFNKILEDKKKKDFLGPFADDLDESTKKQIEDARDKKEKLEFSDIFKEKPFEHLLDELNKKVNNPLKITYPIKKISKEKPLERKITTLNDVIMLIDKLEDIVANYTEMSTISDDKYDEAVSDRKNIRLAKKSALMNNRKLILAEKALNEIMDILDQVKICEFSKSFLDEELDLSCLIIKRYIKID